MITQQEHAGLDSLCYASLAHSQGVKVPRSAMRNTLSILLIIAGCFLIMWGVSHWISEGLPVEKLWPYKNTFGLNVIHSAYIGMAFVAYGAFDIWLRKQ